jgi:hypothetical protein
MDIILPYDMWGQQFKHPSKLLVGKTNQSVCTATACMHIVIN